jgi:phosphoribosylformylglycinamidine cyclo-ligase
LENHQELVFREEGVLPEGASSYEAAGVSIDRGDQAAKMMRASVEGTHGPEIVSPLGGVAGL